MDHYSVARELVRIIPLLMHKFGADLRCVDPGLVSSHFRVLVTLAHASCSLKELAEKQSVTEATMSNTISTLVDRGWVRRTVHPQDRRKVVLQISPDGLMLLREVQNRLEQRVAEYLSPLEPDQLRLTHEGLTILRTAFEAHLVHDGCYFKDHDEPNIPVSKGTKLKE